jgi:5-methylcytosine-specific restriction endonuclease McrA
MKGKRLFKGVKAKKVARDVSEIVRDLKGLNVGKAASYRESSLRLHGLICAKCGREFDESDRHLLTVHHRDSNHSNNPTDGSNWENLCIYCHDDEHSRGILADEIRKK